MIDTPNVEEAKRLIAKEKKPVIVKAQDPEFNRKILEYGKFDILLSIEKSESKKSLRQIHSGFNHVLAAIAHKNNVALGIDLKELQNLPLKEQAERLSKLMQNIELCRKDKVRIVMFNSQDKRNAFNFLIALGASTAQAKEAISF
jgi:RNase P/RNase MRP subunit p30